MKTALIASFEIIQMMLSPHVLQKLEGVYGFNKTGFHLMKYPHLFIVFTYRITVPQAQSTTQKNQGYYWGNSKD